jgi:hypothetical protein
MKNITKDNIMLRLIEELDSEPITTAVVDLVILQQANLAPACPVVKLSSCPPLP